VTRDGGDLQQTHAQQQPPNPLAGHTEGPASQFVENLLLRTPDHAQFKKHESFGAFGAVATAAAGAASRAHADPLSRDRRVPLALATAAKAVVLRGRWLKASTALRYCMAASVCLVLRGRRLKASTALRYCMAASVCLVLRGRRLKASTALRYFLASLLSIRQIRALMSLHMMLSKCLLLLPPSVLWSSCGVGHLR
jgi:hypothetical protein